MLCKHFSFGLCRNVIYIVNIIEKLFAFRRDDNSISIDDVPVER